jgi:vacuolar protein sorting-associated protein 13A/C
MVIGRLETYDVSEHPPKVGKRIRVAATTPVNLNISAASLEALIETSVSWNGQTALETISSKRSEVVFYLYIANGKHCI